MYTWKTLPSALNQKLGRTSNQVAQWEAGRAQIKWEDFCNLCEKCKIPLSRALKKHLFYENSPVNGKDLIRHLVGNKTLKETAKRLSISSASMSRLLKGSSSISLQHIFSLIELSPYSLSGFVVELVPENPPNIIQEEFRRLEAEKNLHFEHPWVGALLLYLLTTEYKISKCPEDFLISRLQTSGDQIRSILGRLENLGLVKRKDKHFKPVTNWLSVAGNFEGNKKIRKYWLSRCIRELENLKPGQTSYYGYKLLSTSPEIRDKIRQLYFKFYNDLDDVLRSYKGTSDAVDLICLQWVDVAKLPREDN